MLISLPAAMRILCRVSFVMLTAAVLVGLAVCPGNAVAGTLTPTPTSHDFGNVQLGGSSQTTFEIDNSGTDTQIDGVVITGAGASSFQVALCTDPPVVLGSGMGCTLTVTFQPTTAGAKPATVTLVDDNAVTDSFTLSGTGVNPEIEFSTSTVMFGSQAIEDGASDAQVLTISNTGSANLMFTYFTTGAQAAAFPASPVGCGAIGPYAIAPGDSCQFDVTFDPSTVGANTASLNFTTNDYSTSSPTVNLTGTGTVRRFDPDVVSIDFGEREIGAGASNATQIELGNSGTGVVAFDAPTLTGANAAAFALGANTCDGTLAPAETCTLDLTFDPSTVGALLATLTWAHNAAGGSAQVSLSGNGTPDTDSTPPSAPTWVGTVPGSPANNNSPRLRGTAEEGSTVNIYTNSTCTGEAVATGTAALFEGEGIIAAVSNNSTTTFYATATDAAENVSSCSAGLSYREDSLAPVTRITLQNISSARRRAVFKFSSSEAFSTFTCKLDRRAWVACKSGVVFRCLARGKHVVRVQARDRSGNLDPTPATRTFRIR